MKLPPYGKHITAASNLFIFAGQNAWDRAKQRKKGNAMILPDGDKPRDYRWPVSGQQITLIWPDASREAVRDFGKCLIQSGAELVAIPYPGESAGGFFFREQS